MNVNEGLSALSNDTRRKLARYIQKNKMATFKELRTEFNLNNNTLMFHLQKLQDAYIVSQPKERGAYQIGELGETMLSFVDELESEISLVIEGIKWK